jgi:uncharacterized membrane protein
MRDYEESLARWQGAGVLDAETATRIRTWEETQQKPSGLRWQVLLALICGALLLTAGTLLFVAAHWDQLSSLWRFVLVMAILTAIHLSAIIVREQFDRLATVLHGVGTAAAGAAIALVGQIFNMQEHWPAAILLWALCAVAGWWLLHDQVQQILALLLIPMWLFSEWDYHYDKFHGAEVYTFRMLAVWATLYLTVFLHGRHKLIMGVLFAAGALWLVIALCALSYGWGGYTSIPSLVPALGRSWAWLLIVALPMMFAGVTHRRAIAPVMVVSAVVTAMPFLTTTVKEYGYVHSAPGIFSYLLGAAVTIFLAWWGVQLASKLLINYGIVCFGLVVMWFYFSDLMSKMDRSLGLMVLGVVFFLGGWLLEKMRRRLVRSIGTTEASA